MKRTRVSHVEIAKRRIGFLLPLAFCTVPCAQTQIWDRGIGRCVCARRQRERPREGEGMGNDGKGHQLGTRRMKGEIEVEMERKIEIERKEYGGFAYAVTNAALRTILSITARSTLAKTKTKTRSGRNRNLGLHLLHQIIVPSFVRITSSYPLFNGSHAF